MVGSSTLSYALSIGLRYLRSKKRKTISVITFIAVAGVALGVGALLTVMAITGGFQDATRNKILGVNAHVLILKYGLDFGEYREVVDHAEELPEVAGAAPFVIHEMMLAKGDRLSVVLVKGIDPDRVGRVLDLPSQILKGSLKGLRLSGREPPERDPSQVRDLLDGEDDLDAYLRAVDQPARTGTTSNADAAVPQIQQQKADTQVRPPTVHVPTPEEMEAALGDGDVALPDDAAEASAFKDDAKAANVAGGKLPGAVVGAALAETLGLELGDHVRIISPLAGLDTSLWQGAGGGAPRSLDFQVTGIFEAGFQEYDSRLVYVDLYESQRFFDHGDSVTGVELRLSDLDQAPRVARQLEADLGGGPYHTMDWRELNHNLFTALEMQKVMLSLVIATIIFVAAFNVIATLIMLVLEKKREIAILKAMGAKDSSILSIFLMQGILIGVVGTGVGLLLGGAVTAYLSVYQFPLDPKVYMIDHLPVRVSASEFLNTVLIALGICTTAGLVPSYWAARLLPADGVRYE
ncbi:MAG: Lipoprotein releasing system transrane protein LolC [Myxococcaceae bacterium]|nr:Lipoprotein releasing system transrane protein LolC [Myxococcaceae bacterium]